MHELVQPLFLKKRIEYNVSKILNMCSKVLFFSLIVIFFISSCKKEESLFSKEDIIGKWEIVSPTPEPENGEVCSAYSEFIMIDDTYIYTIYMCDGEQTQDEKKAIYTIEGDAIKGDAVFYQMDLNVLEFSGTEMKVKQIYNTRGVVESEKIILKKVE